jgi:ElaB/YqjD/DUF883 family membrane-anchored ribosome-binding protein
MPTDVGLSTGDEAAGTVINAAQSAKDKVGDAAAAAMRKVSEAGRQVSDQLDEKRETAADVLQSTASAIHEKAEDLPGGETVENVAHSAADKLEATAGYIRKHDIKAMLSDIQAFVKRNPVPSVLIAASIGFLIGRALRKTSI